MLIVLVLLTSLSIKMNANRFDSGYFQLLMTKGGNKYSYILGVFLSDVAVHAFTMTIMLAMMYFGGVRMTGMWLGVLVFCICNPLFIILVAFFC